MTAKKNELPEIIESDVLAWALNGGDWADIRRAIEHFQSKYPEAKVKAQEIIKLLNKQPSFQHFSSLSDVDGVTIFCLLHELGTEALEYGKKIEKIKGGKERAKNNEASKALKKISNIDWPSHPYRELIVMGKRGYKKKFVDEMASKYPEIKEIKTIDDRVVELKKRAHVLDKLFPVS